MNDKAAHAVGHAHALVMGAEALLAAAKEDIGQALASSACNGGWLEAKQALEAIEADLNRVRRFIAELRKKEKEGGGR